MASQQHAIGSQAQPLLPPAWRDHFFTDLHVHIQGADVRVRTNGGLPTATDGVLLVSGGIYSFGKVWALRAQVIATAATPAILTVEEH